MPEEERTAFEQRIAEDETLATKVEEMKFTNEAIYYANLSILKENIGRDLKEIKYHPDSNINWKLLLSFTLFTLTVLGVYLFLSNNKSTAIKDNNPVNTNPIEQHVNQKNPINDSIHNRETGDNQVNQKGNTINLQNTENKTIKTPEKLTLKPVTDTVETTRKVVDQVEKVPVPEVENSTVYSDTLPENPLSPEKAGNSVTCTKLYKIHTTPSCKEKPSGTITVVAEGTEELGIEIDNMYKSHSNKAVRELSLGSHEVKVFYKNECTFTEQVVIEEKFCPLNSSYSFNPDYGEKWKINYKHGDAGRFVIYNSFGKELYESEFGIGNEFWNGTDSNGAIVATGNYLAIIKYSDGRSERVELTIVR